MAGPWKGPEEGEEMSDREKKMMSRRSKIARQRKEDQLFGAALWVAGTIILLVLMWSAWAPGNDWTVAIRWILTTGAAYNLIWSLRDFVLCALRLNDDDSDDY